MMLKNVRVGLLVRDWQTRVRLGAWLMQQGAIVYGAKDTEELELIEAHFQLDFVVQDRALLRTRPWAIGLN